MNELKKGLQELKEAFDKFNKAVEKRIEINEKIDNYCKECKNILAEHFDEND